MNDLDTLRPEVREAVAAIDNGNGVFVNADDCIGSEKWKIVRAELLRLAEIEKERWGVVATRNAAIERAYKAEAELAALKARIAGSVELTVGDPAWSDGTLSEMDGLRVALVRVED